jgi:hypothetical protein
MKAVCGSQYYIPQDHRNPPIADPVLLKLSPDVTVELLEFLQRDWKVPTLNLEARLSVLTEEFHCFRQYPYSP